MKKIISWVLVFVVLFWSAFAYEPTQADSELRNEARNKVDNLYPGNIDKLLEVYNKLEDRKPYIEVAYGERGVWFADELQEIFVEQLFENNDVCISSYAQKGDTVEVLYTVRSTDGELLRETVDPLAFNPGEGQAWKSLDDTVFGMRKNENRTDVVDTLKVKAGTDGERTTQMARADIEANKQPYIWATYVFGSTTVPWAIIGTVTAMNDETVTFDFENAPVGEEVVLRVRLEMLRKGCQITQG